MYVVNGSIVSGEQYNNNSGSTVPDPIPNGQTIVKKAGRSIDLEQSLPAHNVNRDINRSQQAIGYDIN